MFKRYVRDRAVATREVRTLAMYMEQIYGIPKNKRVIEQIQIQIAYVRK